MRFYLIAVAILSASPAASMTYTYSYSGPDLVCDESSGGCEPGATVPAEEGAFSVDPASEAFGGGNIVFSVFYVDRFQAFQEELLFKDTGETRISTTCDGITPTVDNPCDSYTLPDFITGQGILAQFSQPAFDQTFSIELDFSDGSLDSWYLEHSSDGCSSIAFNVISSIDEGCLGVPWFDFRGDIFERYVAGTPGEWTRTVTPAPIPLPAAGWLILGGLGAFGAVRRIGRKAEARRS